MATKKYTPNLIDPRIQKRMLNSIGFITAHLGVRPRPLPTRLITQELGGHNLGNFLRQLIITTTDHQYSKDSGIYKRHTLNHEGVAYATSSLADYRLLKHRSALSNTSNKEHSHDPSVAQVFYPASALGLQWALFKYKEDLDSLNFNYKFNRNDNRWHHGLQNVKRKVRTKVLASAGLIHDYDIDSALPTMILYHNKELGGDLYPTILSLIENKQQHREYLAQALEIDMRTAKRIITAVFNGARNLSPNGYSQIYHMLDKDKDKLECFKQLDLFINLKQEIKQCWDTILPHYERLRVYDDNGHKKAFNSSQKWHIYSLLEHKAAVLTRTYLRGHNINYFWIHDGWTSDQQIDKSDLETYLRTHTNMQLSITYNGE
jgi:hypothetical protein